MIDTFYHNVIALMPVYKESEAELQSTILSFQKIHPILAMQLVIIVDGVDDSLTSLRKLLFLGDRPVQKYFDTYDLIEGKLPKLQNNQLSVSEYIDFVLIIKHQHGGKRDSIALFLELTWESVQNKFLEFRKLYPGEHSFESILRKHQLTFFMIDSDSSFNSNTPFQLYKTLWHEANNSIYCTTPQVACRFESYFDFFRISQNADYAIYQEFFCAHEINRENIVSGQKVFGLQAGGMFKAAYLMDKPIIEAYKKRPTTFFEALMFDMNEDTYLSSLIKHKNPKVIYDSKATILTSLPNSLGTFLPQRRRWRNGNRIHQKRLMDMEMESKPKLEKLFIKSMQVFKKIKNSPAAYFYLILSIITIGLNTQPSALSKNIIFLCTFLAITFISLTLRTDRFPKAFHTLAMIGVGLNLFVYSILLSLLAKILTGFATIQSVLAFIAGGLSPLLTIGLMTFKKRPRFLAFYGLVIRYLLLDPIYYFILPVYEHAKFNDLSWGNKKITNSKLQYSNEIIQQGKRLKIEKLSIFLIENFLISICLSILPIGIILFAFAISEILYQAVLILSPYIQETEVKKEAI